jgi:uncharacterized protein (TIGR04255 family)
MNDPRKLEINLAEEFPHLVRAPIVEAVIEVRARAQAPWEQRAIAQQITPLLPDYPKTVSRDQIQQEIKLGQEQPNLVTRNLGWHGLQFQSADGKHIAWFTRDGFMFSRLQPYQDWSHLFGEAMRLWQVHVRVAKPLEIQRVGVRFINRIEMEPGSVCYEDYIRLPADRPEGLDVPFTGFFHLDTLAVPGYSLAVNIIRTVQPPQSQNAGVAVILDIDAFSTTPFKMGQEELEQNLGQMRWLKNKVFYGIIAEKALNRFK